MPEFPFRAKRRRKPPRQCVRASMSNLRNIFPREQPPIFNLPQVIIACVAVLAGIHIARVVLLTPGADFELVLRFAFIPQRVMQPEIFGAEIPGGPAAAWWSFVTYALLHANWSHLIINGLWLTAFGAPLAWRFGTARFLLFSVAGAVFGALLFLMFNAGEERLMVGASAAVSAHMAGASRFVFSAGGPFAGRSGSASFRFPAPPLLEVMADRRVLTFVGIWFAINLLFGLWDGQFGAIAWEAHIGGFLAGLLLFSAFDPIRRI